MAQDMMERAATDYANEAAARADERRKVLLEVAEMAEEEARRCDALASGARIDVRWSHQDEAMSFRYLAARLYAKAGEE